MGQGAAINVFNLDRKLLIQNAPTKNQCSRDYFYGTDPGLERAIQAIESGYGIAMQTLLGDSSFLSEENKNIFSKFWLFQHLRTESAALRAVQMTETTRVLADLSPKDFSLEIKEAVQIACKTFANSMHLIDDLKFCIFKNRTHLPFITSDNPAVLTNKWRLEKNRDPGHSFGIGAAGILVLLPLTPKLFFLGYDGDVYNVPHNRGIVELKNHRDVIALNQHQFLHCSANVYVHDMKYRADIIKQYSEIELARPAVRHIVHYAEMDVSADGNTRYKVISPEGRDRTKEAILHSKVIHPRPGVWPSQIKIRKTGNVFTNGTGLGFVRLSRTHEPSHRAFWRERP